MGQTDAESVLDYVTMFQVSLTKKKVRPTRTWNPDQFLACRVHSIWHSGKNAQDSFNVDRAVALKVNTHLVRIDL